MQVSYDDFYNFLKDKSYTKIQGDTFHSEWYIDELGNKIGYHETSSWGAPDIYEINCNLEGNENTLNIVNQILNK